MERRSFPRHEPKGGPTSTDREGRSSGGPETAVVAGTVERKKDELERTSVLTKRTKTKPKFDRGVSTTSPSFCEVNHGHEAEWAQKTQKRDRPVRANITVERQGSPLNKGVCYDLPVWRHLRQGKSTSRENSEGKRKSGSQGY